MALRHRIGTLGESIAEQFLADRGYIVVERNARVHHDEIDLVMRDGPDLVGIEVKTTTNGDDPLEAVDEPKLARVERATEAYRLHIDRIDLVAVTITGAGVTIRLLRGVA